ncbi:MAG: hypothetical protein JXB07_20785 [Anaerolineae bacterium]|nr:hypothetical protein [Anaerolineae bacterium]
MSDELLGKELKSLPPKGSKMPIVIFVVMLIAAFVLTAILWTTQSLAAFFMVLIDAVLIIFSIYVACMSLFGVLRVDIYENGIILIHGQRRERILWQDIVGVQANKYSDLAFTSTYSVPYIVPVFIPFLLLTFSGSISGGGKPYWAHFSHYVLHLRDKQTRELRGGVEFFELMSVFKDKVFKRLTPETVQRFRKGEVIHLTDGIIYSQDGLKGTLVRQTRHSRREVPINMSWDQITRIYFLDQSLRLSTSDGKVTILPIDEIINMPAFLAVLTVLHEERGIPKVARQR